MYLFWKIRYLDTQDKQFKDRVLWLDTNSLNDETKVAIELIHELNDHRHQRKMLQYRHFFKDEKDEGRDLKEYFKDNNCMGSVFVYDYFEDEDGNELSNKRMAEILTGNPNAIMLPQGTRQHDIDYILADKQPIQIDKVSLTQNQLEVLGYFSRDLRELLASAFYKNGPATLSREGGKLPEVKTSVTDEEIRSFVTIFRRLYMKKEPANFLKATTVFVDAVKSHPISNWVKGATDVYEAGLAQKPIFVPCIQQKDYPFARKRIIDVFIYTQYAHQPNEKRYRQYQECLTAAANIKSLLLWLFLAELWHCTLDILNGGKIIVSFYDNYCRCHKISTDVLTSIAHNNPGIGILEKKETRQARLFQEKIKQLAEMLWENSGSPEGGVGLFIEQAQTQLKQTLNWED